MVFSPFSISFGQPLFGFSIFFTSLLLIFRGRVSLVQKLILIYSSQFFQSITCFSPTYLNIFSSTNVRHIPTSLIPVWYKNTQLSNMLLSNNTYVIFSSRYLDILQFACGFCRLHFLCLCQQMIMSYQLPLCSRVPIQVSIYLSFSQS